MKPSQSKKMWKRNKKKKNRGRTRKNNSSSTLPSENGTKLCDAVCLGLVLLLVFSAFLVDRALDIGRSMRGLSTSIRPTEEYKKSSWKSELMGGPIQTRGLPSRDNDLMMPVRIKHPSQSGIGPINGGVQSVPELGPDGYTLHTVSVVYWDQSKGEPPSRLCEILTVQCHLNSEWLSADRPGDSPLFYGNVEWDWRGKQHVFPYWEKWTGLSNYLTELGESLAPSELRRTVIMVTDAFDVAFLSETTHRAILKQFLHLTKEYRHRRVVFSGEYTSWPMYKTHLKDKAQNYWRRKADQMGQPHDSAMYMNVGCFVGLFWDVRALVSAVLNVPQRKDEFTDMYSLRNSRFLMIDDQGLLNALSLIPKADMPFPIHRTPPIDHDYYAHRSHGNATANEDIPGALDDLVLLDYECRIFQSMSHDLHFDKNPRVHINVMRNSKGKSALRMRNDVTERDVKVAHFNGWKAAKLKGLFVDYVRKHFDIDLGDHNLEQKDCTFSLAINGLRNVTLEKLSQFCPHPSFS